MGKRAVKEAQDRPIGIFDSGVGGLTVFRAIRKLLPNEDIVYFGDTARVPYGTKSKDTVIKFSVQNADFLTGLDVKMIVVACNTSSSFSLPSLTRLYDIPVVGVIRPGAAMAAGTTRVGRIGVIGTRATISSGVYEAEIKKINPAIKVISSSCPLFVPLVEEGWLRSRATRIVAEEYLRPLKEAKVDTAVLGCTHYPLLKRVIKDELGRGVTLIDSATQTAVEVKKIICDGKMANPSRQKGKNRFYVSDEPVSFEKTASRFLGSKISGVRKVEVGT